MQQNATEFELTPKQKEAAILVAQDRDTDEKIATDLKINRVTLWRWKEIPAFMSAVSSHAEQLRQAVLTQGIADRVNRIARLDRDWKRMQALVEARAEETQSDVPGASTGLVVRKEKETKYGTDIESVFDAALMAELRATEMQAAKELGQWVEKQSVDSSIDHRHEFRDLKDLSAEELARLHSETIGDPS